jgi:nitroreductase
MNKRATPDHPVQELMTTRWSPYSFANRAVPDVDLRSLFEAARWAASSYNEQPWSFIVATQADKQEHDQLVSCLVPGNQAWAKAAPVLAICCTSTRFVLNGNPNAAAQHDLGLATGNLMLEATARGLMVHAMIGILPDRVRQVYQVPENVLPLTGIAIGYLGDPNLLPEKLRERDLVTRTRKPLAQFVFSAKWGNKAKILG